MSKEVKVQLLQSNQARPKYKVYKIHKGRGRYRIIQAPDPDTKAIQKWLLKEFFYPYYAPFIHSASCGFMPRTSTVLATKPHAGHKIVAKIDISCFFDSILCGEGQELRRALTLALTKEANAWLKKHKLHIGQVLYWCRNSEVPIGLPQGAPTSPFLANLYMRGTDEALSQLAIVHNLSYTRYADDLIFSGDKLPTKFIYHVSRILSSRAGLRINTTKIRIYNQSKRQEALGLTLNEGVRLPRDQKRLLRSIMHRYGSNGMQLPKQVQGMLAYLKSVNESQYQQLLDHYQKHLAAKKPKQELEIPQPVFTASRTRRRSRTRFTRPHLFIGRSQTVNAEEEFPF